MWHYTKRLFERGLLQATFRNHFFNLHSDKPNLQITGQHGCLILFCRRFVHESAPPVLTVFVLSANVVFFFIPLWNETLFKDGATQIVQSVVRELCPGRYIWSHIKRARIEMKSRSQAAQDFLWNSRGKSPSAILPFFAYTPPAYCFSLLLPPHHLLPWAVNVNGCISLSLNFTYDFPGAKHSKQAPLSLSWNAPGDSTHFRRVTRTRPCRAGRDVYDL